MSRVGGRRVSVTLLARRDAATAPVARHAISSPRRVSVRTMANHRRTRNGSANPRPPQIGTDEFFALLASLDGDETKIDLLANDIADEHIASCTDSAEILDAAWLANANNEVATTEAALLAGFTDAKALRHFNDCYDRSINGAAKAQDELDEEWHEQMQKEDVEEIAKRRDHRAQDMFDAFRFHLIDLECESIEKVKAMYFADGPGTVDEWRVVGQAEMYFNVSRRIHEDYDNQDLKVDAGYFTTVAGHLKRMKTDLETAIGEWKERHAEGLASFDTSSSKMTVARWRGQIEACDEILKATTRYNDDLDFVTKFS